METIELESGEKPMSKKQKMICWTLVFFVVLGLAIETYLGVVVGVYIRELRILNTALFALLGLYICWIS